MKVRRLFAWWALVGVVRNVLRKRDREHTHERQQRIRLRRSQRRY